MFEATNLLQKAQQNPLTKEEIHSLVREIAEQPKKVEKETVKLALRLEQKIDKLEAITQDIQRLI